MPKRSTLRAIGVAILVALIVFAALGPAKWQHRTGLGWQFDHIVGYFGFTLMVCIAWPRKAMVVGGAIMVLAALLEGLQAFTPDRTADLHAALYSMSGVLAAAVPTELVGWGWKRLNGRPNVKLTRFRGHPNICVQGAHDGKDETTLHTGIPSPNGRAGPRRSLAGGAGAGV